MSGKNFMSYGDADTILTEFSNDIKSRVSTKANQGLTAQQIANAKANIDIDKVPNVATNDQTPTFLEESTRTNIASGDKLSLIFGKIKKFFSDLKAVAFSGSYNDLSDKPDLSLKADKTDIDSVYSVMGQNGAKNLIPYPFPNDSYSQRGIKFTALSDGTINANGTNDGTGNSTFNFVSFTLSKGSYALNGCPAQTGVNYRWGVVSVSDSTTLAADYGSGANFTINADTEVRVFAQVVSGKTVNNLIFKPMLRLASDTDNTYQPYAKTNKQLTDGKAELESVRDYVNELGVKNLIPYPYANSSITDHDVTFTVNNDGTVIANGTANGTALLYLVLGNVSLSAAGNLVINTNKPLFLSGCPSGGSHSTFRIQYGLTDGTTYWAKTASDIGSGVEITPVDGLNSYCFVVIRIMVFDGYTANNLTFKPMLRLASDINDDTYVQYAMTNKQLTEKKANSATTLAGYGITDAYTKTQVDSALSGKANTSDIPTALSDLTDDSTHRLVTDTEKSTWNGKSNFSGSYNDLTNKPTIPTTLSQLSTDATHRVVTDTEKAAWNGAKTYMVEKCTGGTVKTVSAGSQTEYSVDITKSGYTPIGIVGTRLLYNNKVVLDGFYVSGNNAYICFRNYTTSSVEIQGVRVYVLYVKN